MTRVRLPLVLCSTLLLVPLACGDDAGTPTDDDDAFGGTTVSLPTTGDVVGTTSGDSTGDPEDTDIPPGDSSGENDTSGGAGGCAGSGTVTVGASSILDQFGHLLFLNLFVNGMAMDGSGMEEVTMTVEGDQIGFSVAARDMGSGSGHGGVSEVSGTLNRADCTFDVSGEVPFMSDNGDFGMVTSAWTGTAIVDSIRATFSLSGGNIPSGPIEFEVELQ
ncbi:MAG: hypothetical protein AAF799_24485 [Myxococcota bacterium]